MKMAKATDADLEMANELAGILGELEKRRMPEVLAEQFGDDFFDIDDDEHCREVMLLILRTLGKGSLFRVTFGMLVLLDPANELVDPAATTLEVHPKFEKCAQERDQLEAMVRRLADIMVRSDVDVANGANCPDSDEWDEAIRDAKVLVGEAKPVPEFIGEFRP